MLEGFLLKTSVCPERLCYPRGGTGEGFSQFCCPNLIRPNWTKFMVSRPKIVNYTAFQNGLSSGGDTATQSLVLCK